MLQRACDHPQIIPCTPPNKLGVHACMLRVPPPANHLCERVAPEEGRRHETALQSAPAQLASHWANGNRRVNCRKAVGNRSCAVRICERTPTLSDIVAVAEDTPFHKEITAVLRKPEEPGRYQCGHSW
eukprot:356968-Chlamydomonas_euryale.AAC.35